jgi:hypothetical protein
MAKHAPVESCSDRWSHPYPDGSVPGGRRDPATVTAELTGDERLGRALLTAAPAFAGP